MLAQPAPTPNKEIFLRVLGVVHLCYATVAIALCVWVYQEADGFVLLAAQIYLGLMALLVVAGIGSVCAQRWAQVVALVWALGALGASLVVLLLTLQVRLPDSHGIGALVAIPVIAFITMVWIVCVLSALYPIVVIALSLTFWSRKVSRAASSVGEPEPASKASAVSGNHNQEFTRRLAKGVVSPSIRRRW